MDHMRISGIEPSSVILSQNKIELLMCFIYAFDQSDSNFFEEKILGTASYFFKEFTRGTSYLKKYQISEICNKSESLAVWAFYC